MQLQEKVEKACDLPNLDGVGVRNHRLCVNSANRVPSSFSYELFSADRLVKGSRCPGCFLDLLRGPVCESTNSGIQNKALILGRSQDENLPDCCIVHSDGCAQPGSGPGVAQTRSAREPPKIVSITGCLVKGDEPGEVWLAQKNGRIYGLEGGKIDLNAHLGQRVLVEGYVLPEGKEEAAEEAQKENKAGKRETADLRVRMLKMISKSCIHSD